MNASTEDGEETRKVDFQLCHVTNIIELKIDCNPFILLHLQDSGETRIIHNLESDGFGVVLKMILIIFQSGSKATCF